MRIEEKELIKELTSILKTKDKGKESIKRVIELMNIKSSLISAKALWTIGEIGLKYPLDVKDYVPQIVEYLDSNDELLRQRAINALGRIGRADFSLIKKCFEGFRFAYDEASEVRLMFIWASENIVTNTPEVYEEYMDVYARFLYDNNLRVRREAPEMFRVIGKRIPKLMIPYIEKLEEISINDEDTVVRIHALGALKNVSFDTLSE